LTHGSFPCFPIHFHCNACWLEDLLSSASFVLGWSCHIDNHFLTWMMLLALTHRNKWQVLTVSQVGRKKNT
jgi:hypothetical protein